MKYFLKNSVYFLVFLSVFAIPNPSHGGNSGRGEKKPEETFDSKILVPFKGRPKTNIQPFYKHLHESEVSFLILPTELWQQVFTMLDYDGTILAAQVRKHWRWIILENEGRLNWFFLHPANAFYLYETILPLCSSFYLPQQNTQYTPYFESSPPTLTDQQTHCIPQYIQTITPCMDSQSNLIDQQAHFISKSIQTITSCIDNDPSFRDFLGRLYINLDPSRDFQEVCFASLIIKNSDEMKNLLRNIVVFHAIDFENLPEKENLKNKFWQLQGFRQRIDQDLEHFHNFQPLQQSLMALKLLALTGDEASFTKLKAFKDSYNSMQMYPGFMTAGKTYRLSQRVTQVQTDAQHHFLINYLNWAAYIDDFCLLHNHFYNLYCLLDICYNVKVNPEIIKNFGRHYFNHLKIPGPYYTEAYDIYFNSLLKVYKRQDNPEEVLRTIEAHYTKIKK